MTEDEWDRYCLARGWLNQSSLDQLKRSLQWHCGDVRAAKIMAGEDAATELDLAAWNRLGNRRAA